MRARRFGTRPSDAGLHFCLGAHLARRAITAMLRELPTRVPDIRASAEPDYLLSSFGKGIKHLPGEFGGLGISQLREPVRGRPRDKPIDSITSSDRREARENARRAA
jgi:hypothetical protein